MNIINVKLNQREKNKYRKLISTEEKIYDDLNTIICSASPYTAGAVLEDGEWFYVENAKEQPYSIDLFTLSLESVDFDSLERSELCKVDFMFFYSDKNIFFQKVSPTKLVAKKTIISFGEKFEYKSNRQEIVINDFPDAIYVSSEDRLYFRKLESITSIFRGIDQLYREATDEEVNEFLEFDFISLQDDYSAAKVKTANRKRIALAKKTLDSLDESDQKKIFSYIGEYCPELKADSGSFEIGTEDELKMLLYGIEQRFYTTPVGGEKRLANSVIRL